MSIKKIVFALGICILVLVSCSSAPKRSMINSTIYDATSSLLDSANANILSGDFNKADFLLKEAHAKAMSIDNYDLLTSVTLTRVSLYLSLNPQNIEAAQSELKNAYEYSKYSNFTEKQTALCILSEVRVALANSETKDTEYNSLLTKLKDNEKTVKGDSYNEANFLVAEGDIYKLQKKYSDAEKVYISAAKSFTDNRYLSEIGITWYKAAQVCSLNENKAGALEALENAIHYDRLAENSMALGADYYAKGVILLKGNPTQSEEIEAKYALEHSAQIYESAGFDELAQKSRDYIK